MMIDGWVPITKVLPPESTPVLGWDQYWEEARIYLYCGKRDDGSDSWCWMVGHDFEHLKPHEVDWYPTHWLPLTSVKPSEQVAQQIFEDRQYKVD